MTRRRFTFPNIISRAGYVENVESGSRGTGSRGVENAGSGGKRRVWWKTRGPMENAGSGGKRGV